MRIELTNPLEIQGGQITYLDLPDRFKAKHFRVLPKSFYQNEGKDMDFADIIPFLSKFCGITEEQAEELEMEDIQKVFEVFNQIGLKKK